MLPVSKPSNLRDLSRGWEEDSPVDRLVDEVEMRVQVVYWEHIRKQSLFYRKICSVYLNNGDRPSLTSYLALTFLSKYAGSSRTGRSP
jgi:hypothetical protein